MYSSLNTTLKTTAKGLAYPSARPSQAKPEFNQKTKSGASPFSSARKLLTEMSRAIIPIKK